MNIIPTKLSLFTSVNSLSSGNQIIVLTKDLSDNWVSSKIELSNASQAFGTKRWLSTVPASSMDPIGVHGSEAFRDNGNSTVDYFLKVDTRWYKTTLNTF